MNLYLKIGIVSLAIFNIEAIATPPPPIDLPVVKKLTAESKLKALLSKMHTYQANFNQESVQMMNGKVDEIVYQGTGDLLLSQPNKLVWNIIEPEENSIIADGVTIWQIDPFLSQVTAVSQNVAGESNPLVLLTNPAANVWQQYDVSVDGNVYSLISKSENSQIASLTMHFDDHTLAKFVTIDRQELQTKYVFSQIKVNQPVDSSRFDFATPEGFTLDDQR